LTSGALSSIFPFLFFTNTCTTLAVPRHSRRGEGAYWLTEKCSLPPSACYLVMGGGGDWKKLCISEGRGFAEISPPAPPASWRLEIFPSLRGKTK
jgi:hypothetical protein